MCWTYVSDPTFPEVTSSGLRWPDSYFPMASPVFAESRAPEASKETSLIIFELSLMYEKMPIRRDLILILQLLLRGGQW